MECLEESLEIKETDLVLAAQGGDREAFGQLASRYAGVVYAVALRRLGNHSEAQEVSQEVFVRALEKIGQVRRPECFGGWIRSVAARMALNHAARRGPLVSTEPCALAAACVDVRTPEDRAITAEEKSRVRAGLNRLGKLDRQTLVAFYVEGQSLLEMSDQFDSPIGTIKRRLHVARKRLAVELESLVSA